MPSDKGCAYAPLYLEPVDRALIALHPGVLVFALDEDESKVDEIVDGLWKNAKALSVRGALEG